MLLSRSAARLAQVVERKALNLVVVGLSPTVGEHRRAADDGVFASLDSSDLWREIQGLS